jgi:hypothetical protein
VDDKLLRRLWAKDLANGCSMFFGCCIVGLQLGGDIPEKRTGRFGDGKSVAQITSSLQKGEEPDQLMQEFETFLACFVTVANAAIKSPLPLCVSPSNLLHTSTCHIPASLSLKLFTLCHFS